MKMRRATEIYVPPLAGNGTAEEKEWSEARRFPGRIIVDVSDPALRTASEWSRPDTIWTEDSRQDNDMVEAACVWRTAFIYSTEKVLGDA